MAALPIPRYGLDKLYLFPYYQTRDQYKQATGEAPPAFDITRPPKYWEDPSAAKSTKRTLIYENVLACGESGMPLKDDAGNPYLEGLLILRTEAATVNIPPKMGANEPGTDLPEAPPPVRPLDPDEELFFDEMGIAKVRNKLLDTAKPVAFDASDRALIRAIAQKLGVPLS